MFDRTGSKLSFSGDIHRVATFTHVSSSWHFFLPASWQSKVFVSFVDFIQGCNKPWDKYVCSYCLFIFTFDFLNPWLALTASDALTHGTFWHWRSIWTFCCFPCSLLVPVVMLPFVRLYLSCASRLFFSFDMQPDGGVLSTKVATFELYRVVGKHQDRLTLVGHLNDIYAPR